VSGRAVVLTVAVFLVPGGAWCHPPYERVAHTLTDPSGTKLLLVRSFIDGIVLSDPVKLVVRDAHGETLAETEFVRDVSTFCPAADRCLIFLFEGSAPFLPKQTLRLSGHSLVPATGGWLPLLGVVMHVWNHWLGYLMTLVVVFLPFVVLRRLWRLRNNTIRVAGLALAVPVSALVLFAWLWVILGLSDLSFTVASILIGGVILAEVAVSQALRRSGVRASGPTRS